MVSCRVRLVLLGKTGSGKSSTGNSILCSKAFQPQVSSSSATQHCRRACGDFRGRHLTVLDTPGLLDTLQWPLEVQQELRRSVALMFPGPHVFLLVVPVGRFTKAEQESVSQIQETFGPHVLDFSVVVFTHGDSLAEGGAAGVDCLISGSRDLAELVAKCRGRYCVFNNRAVKNKEQVSELLALVDGVLEANEGGCFTSVMLREAEEKLERAREEAARALREEEQRRKQEQEKVSREWYQGQLKQVELKSVKEMEEMRRSQRSDRARTETVVREKEDALRLAREENAKKEKEWKIQEVMQMVAIRMEEKKKREALRGKLDSLAKTLEEQTEREQSMKRDMEEMISNEKSENERREREREEQQLQKEQAIRQREEVKREALQKEHDRLTQELVEQRRKEEEREKEIEKHTHMEREESQMERQRVIENLNAEKKRNDALQRQLWLITMKLEEHKEAQSRVSRGPLAPMLETSPPIGEEGTPLDQAKPSHIATMTMITASTSLTIFIMNIHFCGAEAKPVPHWAKVVIIDYMSKILFVYEVGENCTTPESERTPLYTDEPMGEERYGRHDDETYRRSNGHAAKKHSNHQPNGHYCQGQQQQHQQQTQHHHYNNHNNHHHATRGRSEESRGSPRRYHHSHHHIRRDEMDYQSSPGTLQHLQHLNGGY
ncbi:hypothetical protein CRUP_001203 [Coryphaenoides rupestris]|nr:hypothetical protein CRUP_001203 [Coryphaenoides rupestris]